MALDTTKFTGGSGTSTNPYLISTPDGLNEIRNGLNYYYKLTKNIDMNVSPYNTGTGFTPIGVFNTIYFNGTLDGNGFKIKNLYINNSILDGVGLFAYLGGIVKNLFLENVNITGHDRVGAISGDATPGTLNILNCGTSGNITGNSIVGGFIGISANRNISNCYSFCNVTSSTNSMIGGFIGYTSSGSVITNCYSKGLVSTTLTSSGFTGSINSATITSCYWDKETSGKTSSAGGTGVVGKTTTEMKTQSTYTGWDFTNTWYMNPTTGYPDLLVFIKIINKLLIKQNSNIYIYNGTNIVTSPSQIIDDSNFITNGFDDATVIPESLWNSTFVNKTGLQLLMWTDDTTKTSASMIYNTNSYKPLDKLGDTKVTGATFTTTDNLTYTVNPITNIPFKEDSIIAYENGTVVTPNSIDLINGKVIFNTARTGTMTFDYIWIDKFDIKLYKSN